MASSSEDLEKGLRSSQEIEPRQQPRASLAPPTTFQSRNPFQDDHRPSRTTFKESPQPEPIRPAAPTALSYHNYKEERRSIFNPFGHHDSEPDDIIPSDVTRSPLSDFRFAVGIYNHPTLTDANRRPASNRGIYQRVIKCERAASQQYKIFAILINGALGLQIIFASALTALGASRAQVSTAVTAFGAMNTILAGFLTFLKGSGLPNRLKYYHNEWSKVREYIEQRERDFARGMEDLDLAEEVGIVERMYESVRRDVEANTPDSYVSIGSGRGGRDGGVGEPLPSLSRNKERKMEGLERRVAEEAEVLRKEGGGAVEGWRDEAMRFVEERFGGTVEEIERRLKGAVESKGEEIESQVKGAVEKKAGEMEEKFKGAENRVVGEVAAKEKDVEDKFREIAEKAAEKVLEFSRR